ncbi:MAG TPA: MBL fold metallo-hydrolase [Pseudogracilibacillus sp.]|nr:MBL fold metallo-hydrolase [Pseudogracilibacillus sp.]
MNIQSFSLGPIGTNCYVIRKGEQCLIIDPGWDAPVVTSYIEKENLEPQVILLTHAHFDHIGAVDELRKLYSLDVYLHEEERDWLENAELNRSQFALGGAGITTAAPDKLLKEGRLQIGKFSFDVVHTPGHSPGSVSFIFNEFDFVVSGDVLFHHGIGRTDLPGGNIEQLARSITEHLYTLPDSFTVYPGHGTSTTIGEEKYANPFTLQFYRS